MLKLFLAGLLGFLPALAAAAFGWPLLHGLLERNGRTAENFRGRPLVSFSGLLIPISLGAAYVFLGVLSPTAASASLPILALVLGAALFGLIDDLLGTDEQKGFKGHFKSLLEGRLTTGALKALGIGAVSLAVAASVSPFPEALLDAAVISLSVNLLNLLDLRPGRALKVFLAAGGALTLLAPLPYPAGLAAGLGAGAVLLKPDLKEEAMLGDVGSNALGAIVGAGLMVALGLPAKLLVLACLIGVQVYAERASITGLIERFEVLRRIDAWGREVD
ncbi:MAG: hypothetical protein ACYC1U_00540 [Candidatus Aquicultorales bacterium]